MGCCESISLYLLIRDGSLTREKVYAGVKLAGKEVENANIWDEANEWLSQRR